MKKQICYMGLLLGLIFLSFRVSAQSAGTSIIPLEDFFRNPESVSYKLSPDGKHIAYAAPYERRLNIFVMDVETKKPVRITSETERDIAGYFWGNNNRILFLKDVNGDENYQLYGINVDGTNALPLAAFDDVRVELIDDLPHLEKEIIIGLNKNNPQVFDPYRLDIETGELTQLAQNPGNILDWMTDHDGKLRVAMAQDGTDRILLYRDTEDDEFVAILTTDFKESVSPFIFSVDNKRLYAGSNIGRDKMALVEFDPQEAKEVKVIYQHDMYDISNVSYSRKNKKILGITYEAHDGDKRHYLEDSYKKNIETIQQKVGDKPFYITSENRNEDVQVIRTYSDKSYGTYYIYDKKKDELTLLAEISPWLDENTMGDVFCVNYKSRDGWDIEAYLTLPKGYTLETAKSLPVIVNPHGGPWARDSWGFNPEVQFLANRGYAVFQMNFRGSTGFGRKFLEASYKQWGLSMQDDITDGVNWLIEKGIADAKKVAIYGASYGGYAVLAGLAFTPDLYACGIDYVGVSNIFTLLASIPPYWKPMLEMMYEQVGDPEKDKDLLERISPVFHSDKIKAPLFIAQGANDPRVNKAESDQMVEAMKKRGIEVQYMVKDDEGHGFYNEENRFDFYRAMEKFLSEHLR